MFEKKSARGKFAALMFLAVVALNGCVDPSPSSPYGYDPYDPYRDSYSEGRRDEYYRQRERQRDLERENRRLERERDRLKDKLDDRPGNSGGGVVVPPRPQPERCPPGFSPSENKCSQEERRRGCKDMRLPGGLGCVRR